MIKSPFPGLDRDCHPYVDVSEAMKLAEEAVKKARNVARKLFCPDHADRELKYGDIIGVTRNIYDHYGVYADPDTVIHYSSKASDTGADNRVIETDLKTFMRGDIDLFRLQFPEEYGQPEQIPVSCGLTAFRRADFLDFILELKKAKYYLYSPDETVLRAKSRLGENRYSLFSNNCEHFAIWCKTNISESHQVNILLKLLKPQVYFLSESPRAAQDL